MCMFLMTCFAFTSWAKIYPPSSLHFYCLLFVPCEDILRGFSLCSDCNSLEMLLHMFKIHFLPGDVSRVTTRSFWIWS